MWVCQVYDQLAASVQEEAYDQKAARRAQLYAINRPMRASLAESAAITHQKRNEAKRHSQDQRACHDVDWLKSGDIGIRATRDTQEVRGHSLADQASNLSDQRECNHNQAVLANALELQAM